MMLCSSVSDIGSLIRDPHRVVKLLLYPLLGLLVVACQTTAFIELDPKNLFHDELFPSYQDITVETEDEVFEIGENATAFVDELLLGVKGIDRRVQTLVGGIFNHNAMHLLYISDANTIASETFKNRAANCLSLTIMTYGMATHANLGVKFQQVNIPELWIRRDGVSLLNRHVNLRLYEKVDQDVFLYNYRDYQLDFDQRIQALRLRGKEISKTRVLALFYNNLGADALIQGDHGQAYAYFRAALLKDNLLVDVWNNLGALYRRVDRMDYAEDVYLQANKINNKDLTTLENLAYIYRLTSRKEEAEKIETIVLNHRKENPYYHFMLGDVQYENGNWLEAIKHYKKSIRFGDKQNEFYFSIAKSYVQLGDLKNSERWLQLAKKYSHDQDQKMYYQTKLQSFSKYQ